MAEQANILILRSVNAGENDIKTVVSTDKLENGFAVALGDVSKERKTRGAYKVTAPATKTDVIALIYNADVPILEDAMGNTYKGIVSDPRNIRFPENTPVNAWVPGKAAEIAMTKVEGTADDAKYVIYKAGSMKPEYAKDTTDALVAFKITGDGFVSIGNERVKTVEMIHVEIA